MIKLIASIKKSVEKAKVAFQKMVAKDFIAKRDKDFRDAAALLSSGNLSAAVIDLTQSGQKRKTEAEEAKNAAQELMAIATQKSVDAERFLQAAALLDGK